MDASVITHLLTALERERVAYKVFGAIALNIHGVARGTQDLDLFVSPEADNIERLRAALREVFDDDPNIDEITHEDLAGDYPAIQYVPPHGTLSIDILSRLGDAYDYGSLEAVRGQWDNVAVSVVSPRQLYEMKRDTVRLKDRADAQRLKERFGLED